MKLLISFCCDIRMIVLVPKGNGRSFHVSENSHKFVGTVNHKIEVIEELSEIHITLQSLR